MGRLLVGWLVGAAGAVATCWGVWPSEPGPELGPTPEPTTARLSDELLMVEDPQTGCQYLLYRGTANLLISRISSDGKSHEGCGTKLEK